jgi:hypothetical protein
MWEAHVARMGEIINLHILIEIPEEKRLLRLHRHRYDDSTEADNK